MSQKHLPHLIKFLSGIYNDNWKGVATAWLAKHKNDDNSYPYHVLQILFEVNNQIKRMNFSDERNSFLLQNSYRAFELKVLKFAEKFHRPRFASLGQAQKVDLLETKLSIEMLPSMSEENQDKYMQSFSRLRRKDRSVLELADENRSCISGHT
ncbi:MAG: hypothetical protein R2877_08465 [Bdellovibrionota bacterium]